MVGIPLSFPGMGVNGVGYRYSCPILMLPIQHSFPSTTFHYY
jgi:hypothetical protein